MLKRISIFSFIIAAWAIVPASIYSQETPTATPITVTETPTSTPIPTSTPSPTPSPSLTPTPAVRLPQNIQVLLNETPHPVQLPIYIGDQFKIKISWDAVEATEPVTYYFHIDGPSDSYPYDSNRSLTWIRPFVHPDDEKNGGTSEDDGRPARYPGIGVFTWSIQTLDGEGRSSAVYNSQIELTTVMTPTPNPEQLPNPDVDGNGLLESRDIFQIAGRWQATAWMDDYLLRADLNTDGKIDGTDFRYAIGAVQESIDRKPIFTETGRPGFIRIDIRPNNAGVSGDPIYINIPTLTYNLSIGQFNNADISFTAVEGAVAYLVEIEGPRNISKVITGTNVLSFGSSGIYTVNVPAQYTITLTPLSKYWNRGAASIPLQIEAAF